MKDEFDEKESKEMPISMKEIMKYRDGIKTMSPRSEKGVPQFDQLMKEWGYSKLSDDGWTTVLNPLEFNYWTRVRDKVEGYDTAKYFEAVDSDPEQKEAHRSKIRRWSKHLAEVFKVKTT